MNCIAFGFENGKMAVETTRTYYACNVQKYGEYGFNPTERYEFQAKDTASARHWIVNHLDCSIEWQIIPAN